MIYFSFLYNDKYLSKNEPKEHLMVKKKEMIVHLEDERRTSHDNFFNVITMYGIFWINVYKASLQAVVS